MRIGIQTWGSDGDIRPFVALGNGLARRGHEVSLVITSVDGKEYRTTAGQGNLKITHTAPPSYDEETILRLMRKLLRARDFFTQLTALFRCLFDPLVDEMHTHSQRLCDTTDLLIGHFICHPLKAAADKAHKEYCTVTLNHLGIPTRFKAPLGLPTPGEWFNPVWWGLAKSIGALAFRKRVNDLRVREGLPPVRDVFEEVFFSQSLNMIAVSSVFCAPMPDWQGRHYVCGFFNVEEEDEQWEMPEPLKSFLAAGPPPVYVTLGSMLSLDPDPGRITGLLAEAVLKSGNRAIIQSRWEEIHDIPDHPGIFKIGKAPHHYIFPWCSAVVHHGGAGTTHSATRCGRPSVVIQHFLDQGFWGKELQRVGIAPPTLDRRSVTAQRLARQIEHVITSPVMKTRTGELGRLMRRERGVERAVELIEAVGQKSNAT